MAFLVAPKKFLNRTWSFFVLSVGVGVAIGVGIANGVAGVTGVATAEHGVSKEFASTIGPWLDFLS